MKYLSTHNLLRSKLFYTICSYFQLSFVLVYLIKCHTTVLQAKCLICLLNKKRLLIIGARLGKNQLTFVADLVVFVNNKLDMDSSISDRINC